MTSKNEILERKDIPNEKKWDIESMFADFSEWEKSYNNAKEMAKNFESYKEKVVSSSENLYNVLNDMGDLYRITEQLYSYAHMKLDEDTREGNSQALSDKGLGLYVEVGEKTSYVVPEILTLDLATLEKYYEEKPELELYKKHIDDIMRQKEHVLSAREESILAQMGEVANSPQKIFSMLNNADIKFPTIKDEEGKDVEVTHGNFIPLMESKDRDVRKRAFEALYTTYKGFKNTFAASLNGDLKKNIFNATVRNYKSSREASLDQNNVSLSVYDNLIKSIHNNLDSMYKYMAIRKRALGVEELHMYDLYTPIVKDVDLKIPYEEGVELVKKA
ncbi:M3 family metallopeptidase [Tissierella sp. P1]|uniref:M3 family metallopeptidase n=2 Tax=Tissierellaceae TaxID=1737406 RepID=UPI001F37B086|nr:M3 family metallopeptidase [Tissierella sp. P1]